LKFRIFFIIAIFLNPQIGNSEGDEDYYSGYVVSVYNDTIYGSINRIIKPNLLIFISNDGTKFEYNPTFIKTAVIENEIIIKAGGEDEIVFLMSTDISPILIFRTVTTIPKQIDFELEKPTIEPKISLNSGTYLYLNNIETHH